MSQIVISGTGLFVPPHRISNEELVNAYNQYASQMNSKNGSESEEIPHSSAEFIEKASGIKQRYAMHKEGMLNPARMKPQVPPAGPNHEAEAVSMGISAGRMALEQAQLEPADIDLVILAATNHQRPYPSIATEIQNKLGCNGAAFDMGIACSSATFGMITACAYLKAGMANRVLLVNPEYVTPQVNLTSRDSHFIFGDVATAVVIEPKSSCKALQAFEILDTRQKTQLSNNIHCYGNYTDHCASAVLDSDRPFFHQEGRKVFKELLPLVTDFIEEQLDQNHITASDLKRMWLHQANINMNLFAAKKILGRSPTSCEAPIILDEFANTASSGSIVAFHKHRSDFKNGDLGLICSFGAGYSIGSLLVKAC
jgi:beta-ketodecanoyl-[acyl-carrier-protein] synthase